MPFREPFRELFLQAIVCRVADFKRRSRDLNFKNRRCGRLVRWLFSLTASACRWCRQPRLMNKRTHPLRRSPSRTPAWLPRHSKRRCSRTRSLHEGNRGLPRRTRTWSVCGHCPAQPTARPRRERALPCVFCCRGLPGFRRHGEGRSTGTRACRGCCIRAFVESFQKPDIHSTLSVGCLFFKVTSESRLECRISKFRISIVPVRKSRFSQPLYQ
jgi:hypothetical protein